MGKTIDGIWVDWIEKVKILQKAVVRREDGLLLAIKRSENQHSRPGKWDLAGGSLDEDVVQTGKDNSGKGDDQDILVKAIKREIREETGLEVKPSSARAIHTASGYNEQKGHLILAIGYVCEVEARQTVSLSNEHSEFKWVSLQEFNKLDIGDDGGLILSILEKVRVCEYTEY